jgi:type II secretory pathway component PulM
MPTSAPSMPMIATARHWFARRAPRERWLLAVATTLLLLAAGWWSVWEPMGRDIARMRGEAMRTKPALFAAKRIADEMPGLARTRRAVPTTPLHTDVERVVTAALGRPAGLAIDRQEQRVHVVLPAVSLDALAALLEALQRDALIQVAEARLTTRIDAGTVRAELTLWR